MSPAQAAALLTIAAAYDNRKPDADAAKAWAMALEDYEFTDCRTAIVTHYRRSREWLMPSDVIDGVKEIQNERVRAFGTIPELPHLYDRPEEHRRYWNETNRGIRDGSITRANFNPPQPPEPPALAEADTAAREELMAKVRAGLGRRVPQGGNTA